MPTETSAILALADVPGQKPSPWVRPSWLVGFFFCLAVVLRVYHFWLPDLWIDEYGTWWTIAVDGWGEVAHRAVLTHGQSPFYYVFVKLAVDFLGIGELALRLPSILFGIGVVGLAYPLGLQLFGDRQTALFALVAFAVNDRLIWYSQDARPYALALFFSMVSFLCYVSLLHTEKRSWRIGYVLATGATYYAHYLFGFIVVIHILHLFVTRGGAWLRSKEWRWTFLLLALICSPGVVQVVDLYLRRESLAWIPHDLGTSITLIIQLLVLDHWVFPALVFIVLAIGFRSMQKGAPHERASCKLLLLWFFVPVAGFGMLPPLFGISILHPRYLLFAAPAALFMTVRLIASGSGVAWRKWMMLGVFLALTFIWHLMPSLQTSGTFSQRNQEGWGKAAEFLKTSAQHDDLILFRTGFVEADFLARPPLNPRIVSFISWPLTAHLPPEHSYQMASLPYRFHDQTFLYLSTLMRKAAEHRRVWIIGNGKAFPDLLRELTTTFHFEVREQMFYGTVQVLILEQVSG